MAPASGSLKADAEILWFLRALLYVGRFAWDQRSDAVREVDRSPITLTAEWVVRRFTTHPPTYVWHAEWRVRVAIRGPLNVRLILLSRVGDTVSWGKLHNSPPRST